MLCHQIRIKFAASLICIDYKKNTKKIQALEGLEFFYKILGNLL